MPDARAGPVGIRLEAVSVRFRHAIAGDVHAVRDLSLTVEPGELLTLLGPSGCGKTTTLRMIAGFQEPTQGRISIGGRDVTHVMANRRDIGFVFQNYALFPHLSVFDNVAYGLRVRELARPEIAARVEAVLEMVGLARYGRQLPHELSGGEQQRVALARAIVIRPSLLLFDEPLSNLDAKLRVQMRLEIQRLQKRLGITAVYVTHDQEEAMAISDRIAVMNRGEIAQQGSAETLYRRPANEFVAQFIGRSNLLAARVVEVAPTAAVVEVQGVRLRIDGPAGHLSPGTKASLVVRPEAVTLRPADDPGALQGTVSARVYLGDKTEYHVEMAGAVVEVVAYNAGASGGPATGDRVGLRLPRDGLVVLPRTGP
jgi:spermidine/putrescine ABC transporter ATP-binding subunit